MISIAFACAKVKVPQPNVIWKNPDDDHMLYVRGSSRNVPSAWHAIPSERKNVNAPDIITARLPTRPRNQTTPPNQPKPRAQRVALRSCARSWKAAWTLWTPLLRIVARGSEGSDILGCI
jgi:hypothetical protein